jgi:hypothetical protein
LHFTGLVPAIHAPLKTARVPILGARRPNFLFIPAERAGFSLELIVHHADRGAR